MRRTSLPVALCLVAALPLGCKDRPEPTITRERLSAQPQRGTTPAPKGAVRPVFVPFADLTAGLAPPERTPLPVPRNEEKTEPPAQALFTPEAEPNNEAGTATHLTLPAVLQGNIGPLPDSPGGDHDWFTFIAERDDPAVLDISVTGVKGVNLGLELFYDSVKGRTRLASIDNGGKGAGESLPNFRLVNGTYFLHIQQMDTAKPAWNVVEPYKVTLLLRAADGSRETEPDDSPLQAVSLYVPSKVSGTVNRADDEDWFSIAVLGFSPLSAFSLDLLPPMDTTMTLTILSQAQEEMMVLTASGGQRLTLPNLVVLEGASSYYLKLTSQAKKLPKGEYSLEVVNVPLKERIELEPNATAETAFELIYEEPLSGTLAYDGDVDCFRLEPTADLLDVEAANVRLPALNVLLSGVTGLDLVLELRGPDGETLLGAWDSGGKGEGEEIPNLALPHSDVYLFIRAAKGSSATNPYVLQASEVTTEGKEIEPNNTPEEATPVAPEAGTLQGFLSPAGDRDCLRLAQGNAGISLTPPAEAAATVSAYSSSGELFFQEGAAGTAVEVPKREGEVTGEGEVTVCVELPPKVKKAPKAPYVVRIGSTDAPEP